MDNTLTDAQSAVQDLFASFFEKECPTTRVRAAEPLGFDSELWHHLLETGVLTMGLAEEFGGGGAGMQELVFPAYEYGRQLAPVPLIEAVVAVRLLSRFRVATETDWFTNVVGGRELASVHLRPLWDGVAVLAPAGAIVDRLVALDGNRLIIGKVLDRPSGIPENLGSSPIATCVIEPDAVVLAEGAEARRAFAQAMDEWRVLTAASLVGLSSAALSIALGYVKDRKIFGAPIAAFQSAKHLLADDVVHMDGCRLLHLEAAWTLDRQDPDPSALPSMAFLASSKLALKSAGDALHVHGGIGFTMEHDIQLYYRRAKAWPLLLGDPRHEQLHLADRLFGPREGR
jgi:alkylation response protein AidB-like acyl-CoA dehydrogenase